MEIKVRIHPIDKDQVELYNEMWLMGIVHLDHFDRPISERLYKGEELTMVMMEV